MTAVVIQEWGGRWAGRCDTCPDVFSRASRPPVQRWVDDHNRTYHPAPGQPDGDAWNETRITVEDTPERDLPNRGSVTIRFRRDNMTNVERITRAEALDLQRHLNHYLKGGRR